MTSTGTGLFLIAATGNILPILLYDPVVKLVSRVSLDQKDRRLVLQIHETKGRGCREAWMGWSGDICGDTAAMTGAWTGSILAYLMGIEYKRALLAIFLGVLIAGAIVTIFCVTGWEAYLWLKSG
jgi:uncharacterized membrane protein